MSNIPTVQDIYAAFGRGDVPAILAQLAEDVDWEYGMADAGVPWLQPRRSATPRSVAFQDAMRYRPGCR